jgi:hypothetical protein
VFEADVKAETLFTETHSSSFWLHTLVFTSAGSLTAFDSVYSPVKFSSTKNLIPILAFSRFKREMKAGAFEIMSSEFERL